MSNPSLEWASDIVPDFIYARSTMFKCIDSRCKLLGNGDPVVDDEVSDKMVGSSGGVEGSEKLFVDMDTEEFPHGL